MADLATGFTRALERAGIPMSGVAFGSLSDRATWIIRYKDATQLQIDQAEALKLSYDLATDTALVDEETNAAIDNVKALQAVARGSFELKSNAWTFAQFVARIKAIYKSL